jgi:AbrB family looped-hinge helix DNA binding protein
MYISNLRTKERKGVVMPIGKIGQRRQVVIPKDIFEALGLKTGDFVEVTQVKRTVVIKPKKIVDADDELTPEEEVIVRKGERQLREGKSKSWQQTKHDLAR